MRLTCSKCKFFKTRQGKGREGECRLNPPVVDMHLVSVWPEVNNKDWCGKAELNLEKYHQDGKKIYTRIDTKRMTPDSPIGNYAG